ncbi:Rho GTPase activation protein [Xylariales sp. PMI_506]|nr:Rho GTPase activation protein [Xylariales sp. PMI_506]
MLMLIILFPAEARPQGIFGVPLRQSITYANVAISLVDDDGKSYIYGYVPIVVAKCGVFLKEKATGVEGIFRLSGSEKRIKELKHAFDSPDRYGKGLVWDGYTVHDAANVLRRYLNDLPEPVVPLDLYEKFREPLKGHTRQAVGDAEGTQLVENFNEADAIEKYQDLIKALPPLNRQLLLYILDLLAVFAAKADENRMTAQNLAAIFQPGMLSHPNHAMAPDEYRLNQCVIIFLIENQDHFLIGMQGTAADEKTKQAIEKGTPPAISTPTTPGRPSGVARSASNASAGAESVSRDGKIRRNRSTSSRHSRQSNGASTPGSPSLTTTQGSGLGRSNTVPSKKSPHIAAGRFQRGESPSVTVAPASPSPATGNSLAPPATVAEEPVHASDDTAAKASSETQYLAAGSETAPGSHTAAAMSQEKLLDPSTAETPSKERGLPNLFSLSPGTDGEKRQPNKLRKKRGPGSANLSAQSSTTSLNQSGAISPVAEATSPIDKNAHVEPTIPEHSAPTESPSEPTPKASQAPSATTLPAPHADNGNRTLKPKASPPTSLHSSFNEGSDMDQVEDHLPATNANAEQPEKEKKRRWRMSRRKDDAAAHSNQNLGVNSYAEASSSTVGSSGHKPRKSWTGDSSDAAAALAEFDGQGKDAKDESKGPIGWIKNKYREAKENVDQKRTKSPPGDHGLGFIPTRGKSLEMKRSNDEKHPNNTGDSNPEPQNIPLPMSPPPIPMTHEEKSKAP